MSPQFPSENTARQVVTSLWGIPRRQPWFPPVRALYLCLVSALYLSLAFAAYWPVLKYPAATLPAGKPTVGVVALFNAWTIWWNADRLANGLAGYWDAPIFWPEKGAFGLSEPQPLTLIVAPVVWLWGPVVAYHIYFLLNVWLNGLFAFLFCRRLKLSAGAAGFCGAYVVALPLIWQQPELLQYTPLWPVIWSWSCSLRLWEQIRAKSLAELGLAVALGFMANLHLGLFSVGLVGAGWLLMGIAKAGRKWRNLAGIYAGLILGILLSLPIFLPVIQAVARHGSSRPLSAVASLSASPMDWVRPGRFSWEGIIPLEPGFTGGFNPGWLRVLFAGVAVGAVVAAGPNTLVADACIFLSLVACLAILGSLGPNFALLGFSPWEYLYKQMPLFSWIRSPYRFAYLAQLAILILSGVGLSIFDQYLNRSAPATEKRINKLSCWLILPVGTILLVEVLPTRPTLVLTPNLTNPPGWVQFLAERSDSSRPIVLLDFPAEHRLVEYQRIVQTMLWQTRFRSPFVNGYSGFFPENWLNLCRTWRARPYSPESLRLLEYWGVELLIRPADFPPSPENGLSPYRLELLYTDKAGYQIYRLTKCPYTTESGTSLLRWGG